MTKKIFTYIFSFSAIAAIITATIIICLVLTTNQNNLNTQLKTELVATSSEIENRIANKEEATEYLKCIDSLKTGIRFTWIDVSGNVIFDNAADSVSMENHGSRPEFIEALKNGRGESKRISETLKKTYIYKAVKLSDGTVFRISDSRESVFLIIASVLFPFCSLFLVLMILSAIIAHKTSVHIIEPILKIDLDNPENTQTYDELSPLINRLLKQKIDIKNSIDKLVKQRDEISTITANMKEGLVVIDSNSQILLINNSAKKMLSNEQELIGENILTLNRSAELDSAIKNAQTGKVSDFVLSVENKQISISVSPVFNPDKLNGCVILLSDITEEFQADIMRKEFSSNVSHELKTPLTSISGYAEIIKNGLADSKDIPNFADRIFSESNRLLILIEDIIKLSQLDEAGENLSLTQNTKEEINILEIAGSVYNSLKEAGDKKNISLLISGIPATIKGNHRIFTEMVYNLIDNAIKYTPNGGNVKIEIGKTFVKVTDTGIGIPQKDKERIFERFYRVDKSRSKETGGTGLGLAIVKHAAIYHGGKINVQSEVGKGSCFTVSF